MQDGSVLFLDSLASFLDSGRKWRHLIHLYSQFRVIALFSVVKSFPQWWIENFVIPASDWESSWGVTRWPECLLSSTWWGVFIEEMGFVVIVPSWLTPVNKINKQPFIYFFTGSTASVGHDCSSDVHTRNAHRSSWWKIESVNFTFGILKMFLSIAVDVRTVQAAGIWAPRPHSPCFAQKCDELKTFPLLLLFFITVFPTEDW